ncbi:MAG: SxtJ family membrane protein [candidate division NC10 bacterium]|nr:SxtJ family membrane protein [candidate division NC10 bacterium]
MSAKELRRFGFTVAIPLALLGGVGIWRGHAVLPLVLGGLAIILTGLAVVAPNLLGPVHRVWMQVAHALGWFNTRVLLGMVYFLVMTPIGILMRLMGRDPLDRHLKDRPSYWVERRRHGDPRGSMEHRF